jgi:ElaB/YqjD/DUF883 family membrane-anchored ribosome-binding protein
MSTITNQTLDRASSVAQLLADQVSSAVQSADGYVRSNPWAAMGAAALAAIAAGILLSRRSRYGRVDGGASEVSGG